MACSGEDILNIDIDPDLLIGLVGKLSLNNIPDFSETLQCLETNANIALPDVANSFLAPSQCDIPSFNFHSESVCSRSSLNVSNTSSCDTLQCDVTSLNHPLESSCSNSSLNLPNISSRAPLQCDVTSSNHPVESSCSSSPLSLNDNQSKDGFLSAIGLLSSPRTTQYRNSSSSAYDSLDDSSNSCDNTVFITSGPKGLCEAKEKRAKNKKGSSTKKANRKVDFVENSTCDDAESHWHNLPFFSGANFPHKSVDNLRDVFAAGRMVYDINLSDIGSSLKLPFNAYEEADEAHSSSFNQNDYDNIVPQSDKSDDLVKKRACGHLLREGANFSRKSDNNLPDIFAAGGRVYDVQLNDIIGGSKLSFNANKDPSCSLNQDPCDNILPQSEKSEDLVEKSVCSPDSGISTSPCPGAVSPFSPQTDDSEEYDDSHYEDDLGILLAELVEIENSLKSEETCKSNVHVPVLKDAKSAEDHKKKIMNFLKEPIFNDLKSQLSQLKGDDNKPSFPELLLETDAQSDCAVSSKTTKKPSSRSKKHKLGMEFKSAVKNELGRHSSIFSKGKHFSSRSKILKQIQDDERIQKQVKLIQKLIVSKKLKRIDIDDCENENKKRRIHLTEPCDKSLE